MKTTFCGYQYFIIQIDSNFTGKPHFSTHRGCSKKSTKNKWVNRSSDKQSEPKCSRSSSIWVGSSPPRKEKKKLQPVAFGISFFLSEVSINNLVLEVSFVTFRRKETIAIEVGDWGWMTLQMQCAVLERKKKLNCGPWLLGLVLWPWRQLPGRALLCWWALPWERAWTRNGFLACCARARLDLSDPKAASKSTWTQPPSMDLTHAAASTLCSSPRHVHWTVHNRPDHDRISTTRPSGVGFVAHTLPSVRATNFTVGSHSTLALRIYFVTCNPSSRCRFWVLNHFCSSLSQFSCYRDSISLLLNHGNTILEPMCASLPFLFCLCL